MSQEIREQIDKVRNWKKPLNEDFFSPQRNFNEAIYLTYVESHSNNFRHVSKENFYKYLADKKSKSEEKSFDKNNKYRLADSKEIWYNNRGIKIGEIWRQAKETNADVYDFNDELESYWINSDALNSEERKALMI